MSNQSLSAQPILDTGNGRDIVFAVFILFILAVLFLPIPAFLIDLGLAISIAFSVLILMVSLWIQKPLHFSSFPTVLLIATMLRLSLNISTTRLILSQGHQGDDAAGEVIRGFSTFIMGGDFVIGVIVFLILITINFMVITKGASRIAEVGARFTLDAIPGKQMAIDADLSAGLLNEKEAQSRRRELEEESSFFGSMDGASKFVRGDAIAGLIITSINIFGGIIIGVVRHDMAFAEATNVFTRLSVGDGLVSQIPALIVSLAAGLLISKGGNKGSADRAVLDQLANYPRALFVSSGLLMLLALTPGLPFIPFVLLALACGIMSYIIPKNRKIEDDKNTRQKKIEEVERTEEKVESLQASLAMPEIELVIGKQLGAKIMMGQGEIDYRVNRMRKKFAKAYGFIIPEIKLTNDLTIDPKGYSLKIFGATCASETVSLTDVIVVANEEKKPQMPFEDVFEPVFGAKAWKVSDIYVHELKQQGFQVIDPLSQILTHLSEVVRNNLSQLFSYRDMRALVGSLDKEYTKLVEEICPTHLSFSGLQAIFKLLLSERVSVRNVNQILEAIAEISPYSKRHEQIVEHVRTRISQQICGEIAHGNKLHLLRLGAKWDLAFANAIKRDARNEISEFVMLPADLEDFGKKARDKIQELTDAGEDFAISTSPESRSYVRMIIERLFPTLPVLSNLEIARGLDVHILGVIED